MRMDVIPAKIKKPVKSFFIRFADKDYFEILRNSIINSPTACGVLLLFKKFCVLPNILPEYEKLWEKIIDEKASFGRFTLWVRYSIDLEVDSVEFRLSEYYVAKIKDYVGNVSQFENIQTGKVFPSFNPNKSILKAQIEDAGGFEKFSGQIYQYNTTSMDYELSPFFPVINWMATESETPNYISGVAINDIQGSRMFITKKLGDSFDEEGQIIETSFDKFKRVMTSTKGTDSAGQNFILEINTDDEDVSKLITTIDLASKVDVDKFNSVDSKAEDKICIAFYGFPKILLSPNEGVFGNSGEALREAESHWKTTCEFEAQKILNAFSEIGIKITSDIVEAEVHEDPVDERTLDSQSTLKGSVGGVQSILQIQASYVQGTTSYESAIAMLELIFGFSNEEAKRLLGNPQPPDPTIEPITPASNGN
jgi:hypothetical protein